MRVVAAWCLGWAPVFCLIASLDKSYHRPGYEIPDYLAAGLCIVEVVASILLAEAVTENPLAATLVSIAAGGMVATFGGISLFIGTLLVAIVFMIVMAVGPPRPSVQARSAMASEDKTTTLEEEEIASDRDAHQFDWQRVILIVAAGLLVLLFVYAFFSLAGMTYG